jgi:pSer/pThr/pTyr-binding forkhead associated (FHA) protein
LGADIPLKDAKASREHIELTKVGSSLVLTDLGSQNGTLVNEQKVNQHRMVDGDKIIIGQTVIKYSLVHVQSHESNIFEDETDSPQTSKSKSFLSSKILYLVLGLLLLVVFFPDSEKDVEVKKKKAVSQGDIDEVGYDVTKKIYERQRKEDKNLNEKLNNVFQKGLREFREKNYLRALQEFNMALIINPEDSLAQFYKRKTEDLLDKDIEEMFVKARREFDTLKYKSAIVSYCGIIRLLYSVPEDKRYKDAQANIRKLEEVLGYNSGEINCIEK